MSDLTDKLRKWATDDRALADSIPEQVTLVQYLARVGPNDAHASQSEAEAVSLESAKATLAAVADGWNVIAADIDIADGTVVDPEQHP